MARTNDNDVPDDEHDGPISKTQLKREMLALQKLGESLIDLPPSQYNAMPLPEELRRAVDAARGMTKRGALHRQRQFIGRVMREIDPAPIEAAMHKLLNQDRHSARDFHRVEALRDRLLDVDDADAFGAVCEQFPTLERQQLRHKIRAARSEAQTGKPVGGKRALFRYLHALLRAGETPDS